MRRTDRLIGAVLASFRTTINALGRTVPVVLDVPTPRKKACAAPAVGSTRVA